MIQHYSEDYSAEEKILKYKYKILIKKDGLKANEIKKQFIENRFFPLFPNENILVDNAIHHFINSSLQQHFRFSGNSKAYLSNYQEREGSLEISFLIVIICGYGGIRETMDYFYEDLSNFFNSDSQFDVSINYENQSSKKIKRKPVDNDNMQNILILEKQIRQLKRFSYFIFFLVISLGMYCLILNDKIVDNDDTEKIIDKKIDDKVLKLKIDYIYTNEVLKNQSNK